MFVRSLVQAVTSFIVATSFQISDDHSILEIGPGEILPQEQADVLEGGTVKGACGSFNPVVWTFVNHPIYSIFVRRNYIQLAIFSFMGDTSPLPDSNIQQNNSIILTNLKISDSGVYHCYGTYRTQSGMIRNFMNYFRLVVYPRNVTGIVLPSVTHVYEGENVTLFCGSSRVSEWYFTRSGQDVQIANNELFLYNVRKEDSGSYLCRGVTSYTVRTFQSIAYLFVGTRVVFREDFILDNTSIVL